MYRYIRPEIVTQSLASFDYLARNEFCTHFPVSLVGFRQNHLLLVLAMLNVLFEFVQCAVIQKCWFVCSLSFEKHLSLLDRFKKSIWTCGTQSINTLTRGQKSNAQTMYDRAHDVKRVKQERRISIGVVFMTNHSKHFRSSIPTQMRVYVNRFKKLFQDTLMTKAILRLFSYRQRAVNAIILPRTHQTQKTRQQAARNKKKKTLAVFIVLSAAFC